MSTPPLPWSRDELNTSTEFVRAVARRLVRYDQDAADLVHNVWVVALKKSPGRGPTFRRWLGAAARRIASSTRRGQRRRARRERAAAVPARILPASTLVERMEAHRLLVEAVLELDEPYRTTILLRFFEGISCREVAQREALPLDSRSRFRRVRTSTMSRSGMAQ
ncbi:MAG: sigma-70 family RNA polymerase sigma factor [Planctomycetota bacterium]